MKKKTSAGSRPTSFRLRSDVLDRAQVKARATGDSLVTVVEQSLESYARGGFPLGACDHLRLKTKPFPAGYSPLKSGEWGALAR